MQTTEEIPLDWTNKAIARYKSVSLRLSADDDRKSGNKRHIVAIDDSLKINYEVIRQVPGQLSQSDELEEINRLKLSQYKDQLNKMHEEYIDLWQQDEHQIEEFDYSSLDPKTLEQYKLWMTELNQQLKDEYHNAVQEEKKWFVMKETLLEATARLDICSESNPLLNKNKITVDESKGTLF